MDGKGNESGQPVIRIFFRFLLLGCLSFGGPMAHLAWFERMFVTRLKWIRHEQLANLIALCQALPGPGSSQTAMGIGYLLGRWPGFWAAWIGFTLPSAAIMISASYGALALGESVRLSLVHGMKVAVVGVIAIAVWRMGTSLLKDTRHWAYALAYASIFLVVPSPWVILLLILAVALVTLRMDSPQLGSAAFMPLLHNRTRFWGGMLLGLFILFQVFTLITPGPWTTIPAAFYQTGLLVFGGGHVVLPLLEGLVVDPGWVSQEAFLFGYGTAQMIPGPIFSFSAYLGAQFPLGDSARLAAGLVALFAIYLPSFLLLAMLLPGWHRTEPPPHWKQVLANLHPLVVGLLLATWVNPVLTSAMHSWVDGVAAAVVAFLLFRFQRLTVFIIAATAGAYVMILS